MWINKHLACCCMFQHNSFTDNKTLQQIKFHAMWILKCTKCDIKALAKVFKNDLKSFLKKSWSGFDKWNPFSKKCTTAFGKQLGKYNYVHMHSFLQKNNHPHLWFAYFNNLTSWLTWLWTVLIPQLSGHINWNTLIEHSAHTAHSCKQPPASGPHVCMTHKLY